MAEEKVFDWDDFVEDDSDGFSLLEPGEYEYLVTDVQKDRSKNDDPMIVLTLQIGDPIGSKTTIKDYIVLKSTLEWKISQVLRSLGLKKHGERVPIRAFQKAQGLTGRCKVKTETSEYNGKTYTNNKIDRYLDPQSDTDDFSW